MAKPLVFHSLQYELYFEGDKTYAVGTCSCGRRECCLQKEPSLLSDFEDWFRRACIRNGCARFYHGCKRIKCR